MANSLRLQPAGNVIIDTVPSAVWTMGTYVVTLGLWGVWRSRHRFILTNQRVIILMGIISKREKAVPLNRIQDVTLVRSLTSGGHIAMSSAGGPLSIQRIGPLSRENARRFADAVSARIHHGGDGLSVGQQSMVSTKFPPMPPSTPAQWTADPSGQNDLRYWDGQRWTEHVSEAK